MLKTKNNYPKRQRIYFAAPLFNEAERSFNARITGQLEKFTDVYLPQRDGGLMSKMVEDGVSPVIASRSVFNKDMDAIRQSDYVIAILDGRSVDEGVAFELGVAFSLQKRCIGLQTDSRRLASWGNNPMVEGALEKVFSTTDGLIEWAKNEFKRTEFATV